MAAGVAAVHARFAALFLDLLGGPWRASRPPPGGLGVMAFPPLFAEWKAGVRGLGAPPR